MKKLMNSVFFMLMAYQGCLGAHCQMPCGIYHDDMEYDRIDQYVETMYKAMSVLNTSKFSDTKERNEFMRWVMQKEKASDEAAHMIMHYFLQQKILPGGDDTIKKLIAAHNLLYYTVCIKQTVDLKFVNQFYDEWEKFKLMFHREGYEVEMEKIRLQKEKAKKEAAGIVDDHKQDHPQIHDHAHANGHAHDHDHSDDAMPGLKKEAAKE